MRCPRAGLSSPSALGLVEGVVIGSRKAGSVACQRKEGPLASVMGGGHLGVGHWGQFWLTVAVQLGLRRSM